MNAMIDLAGQVFGRLTVLRLFDKQDGRPRWLCRCQCNTEMVAKSSDLRRSRTRSCGCLIGDSNRANKTTHGHAKKGDRSSEYRSWQGMSDRCYVADHISYPHYGGRGVTVCDRWLFGADGKGGFECFLMDMGPKPTPEHSIDRFPNNDGNYEPGNCRWATDSEQARNRTDTVYVDVDGKAVPLVEVCATRGLPYETILARITRYGWSKGRAISQPVRPHS